MARQLSIKINIFSHNHSLAGADLLNEYIYMNLYIFRYSYSLYHEISITAWQYIQQSHSLVQDWHISIANTMGLAQFCSLALSHQSVLP